MNQYVTKAIVLRRTNYGEADRIMTFLTPHSGKVRVIAKGVRKVKSKLAGGIELFSECNLTLIRGKSDLQTLVSSRLEAYYGDIVKDLERTKRGYEFIQLIDAVTEDAAEEAYYRLLSTSLQYLNVTDIQPDIAAAWFFARLLHMTGHTPELGEDVNGERLEEGRQYLFDFSAGRFQPTEAHGAGTDTIKLLRIIQTSAPARINKIKDVDTLLPDALAILEKLARYYLSNK